MRSLLKYLKGYKKECVLSPLFKLLEAAFELIVPLVVASLIDNGIGLSDKSHILKMGGLLIFFGAAGLTFALTAQYFAAKAATGFSAVLRRVLFEKIQSMDFPTLDAIGTDTLITRMSSDVDRIQNGVNMFLRLLLRSPFIVFGAVIMAFTVDVPSAYVFAALVICLFFVVFYVMRVTAPAYLRIQGRLDRISGKTRENLTGVRVIRAFHREKKETEEFKDENSVLFRLQEKTGVISALTNPLTIVLVNLFTAALLYSSAIRVDTGMLTRGEAAALINYMAQILIELIKLANFIVLLSKAGASADRVAAILNMEDSLRDGALPFPDEKEGMPFISFDKAYLSYQGSHASALEDISFDVEKGMTVGIIGGTGSGKSSLINLIPGFYDATEGVVRINGEDIRNIEKSALRDRTAFVFQKAELFSGSVRDNLKYGDPDAGDEALLDALRAAEAYDFVMDKEGGLDHIIEEGGRNLSGGQKQRLTIARALVKKPEILILDDAASALDYATDRRLRENIRKMSGDLTMFIVSQRAASVRYADMILVMDDGRIAGKGTHEELLRENAVYQEIYYSQFPEERKAGA
ncbi:MAG: ABC transporter ATP-binding protein/permease [Lachnospiraceae bacterium]|nr:ABC transporter ATP-binding protein/permease [Lachnospiraceae bacterium]